MYRHRRFFVKELENFKNVIASDVIASDVIASDVISWSEEGEIYDKYLPLPQLTPMQSLMFVLHNDPVKPSAHKQSKLAIPSTQVELCSHGELTHSLISLPQFNPGKHRQYDPSD